MTGQTGRKTRLRDIAIYGRAATVAYGIHEKMENRSALLLAYPWGQAPAHPPMNPCLSLLRCPPCNSGVCLYIISHFLLSTVHHLSCNVTLCFTRFQMSEIQQQSLKECPCDVVMLPNTVPPVSHNQSTLPRDCVSSTYQVLVSSAHRRRKYPRMVSSCLHRRRPTRLTLNHTV